MLAERLTEQPDCFDGGWNFGIFSPNLQRADRIDFPVFMDFIIALKDCNFGIQACSNKAEFLYRYTTDTLQIQWHRQQP